MCTIPLLREREPLDLERKDEIFLEASADGDELTKKILPFFGLCGDPGEDGLSV